MPTEQLYYLANHASMALASLMLAALMYRRYGVSNQTYLLLWSLGWLAIAFHEGVNAFSYFWVATSPGAGSLLRLIPSAIAAAGAYCAAALFLYGSSVLLRPDRYSADRLKLLLAGAVTIALVIVVGSLFVQPIERLWMRVGLASLTLGLALFITAWQIRKVALARQQQTRFLSAMAFWFGLLQVYYFVAFSALAVAAFPIHHILYLAPLELLLVFGVGVGMLVWQLEEEQGRLAAATEALAVSEENLVQSQKVEALGRLAGGIAHDFNNLLTVIMGYGEVLAIAAKTDSDVKDAAGQIQQATRRASNLTSRLLAFSRREVTRPAALLLDAMVTETAGVAERLVGEKVRLRSRLESAGAVVEVDPGQFQQVLINLVINARDAMGNGGEMMLHTFTREIDGQPWCGVEVQDNGVGMDAETVAVIFDPFFTTKGVMGTGLGLPTARGIVERAGGRMEVHSTPGAGTRVSVLLPVSAARPDDDKMPAPTAAQVASLKILLVEDDPGVRELTSAILRREGHTLAAEPDAEAGYSRLEEERFDLLLSDVVLPGMTGVDLVDKALAQWPGLAVVLMTGYAAQSSELVSSGRYIVVNKPFRRRELLEAMQRAVTAGADAPLESAS